MPAEFQQTIDRILTETIEILDNIIICTKAVPEENLTTVESVLKKLDTANVGITSGKIKFMRTETKWLVFNLN